MDASGRSQASHSMEIRILSMFSLRSLLFLVADTAKTTFGLNQMRLVCLIHLRTSLPYLLKWLLAPT